MAAVVARDVRKQYGDTVALDGVSLTVEEGEVFGLIGPNGAGKTTLTRALVGTTEVEGEVELLGQPPVDVDPQRIGLLPQEFDPPERLTARELVEYYAGLYDEARDPTAVLSDVGLTSKADTWYENLSGGQKRRVCVGTALVNDPDVLLLDEPTTGIDPAGRRDVWGLVEDLAATGTTVILTTHYMAEAEHLADRVGLLADGGLVATGPPGQLVEQYGGAPSLELLVSDPDAAVDALEAAGYTPQVEGDEVVVEGVDPEGIAPITAALDSVDIESLVWHQPDLEQVYLSLTGERLDGGLAPAEVSA